MSASGMRDLLALYNVYKSKWQSKKQPEALQDSGICAARYLAENTERHWFSGAEREMGTVGLFIFLNPEEQKTCEPVISALFSHLDKCHACVHNYFECDLSFKALLLECELDAPTVKQLRAVIKKRMIAHWEERADTLLAKVLEPAAFASLDICFHAYTLQEYLFSQKQTMRFEPFALDSMKRLAVSGYRWLPGYFAILNTWRNEAINTHLKALLETDQVPPPRETDVVFLHTFMERLDVKCPLGAMESIKTWENIWGTLALYLKSLSKTTGTNNIVLNTMKFMQRCVSLENGAIACLKEFATKGDSLKRATMLFCRTHLDTGRGKLNRDNSVFFSIINSSTDALFSFMKDLLKDTSGMEPLRVGGLVLLAFNELDQEHASELLEANSSLLIRCLSYFPLKEPKKLEVTLKKALSQHKLVSILQEFKIQTQDETCIASMANKSLLFRCLRPLVFMPFFSASKDDSPSEAGEFEALVQQIFEHFSSCSTRLLTQISGINGILSTLWLFSSSTDTTTAETCQRSLSKMDSSKLDPTATLEEIDKLMGFVIQTKSYTLGMGHSIKAIEASIRLTCLSGGSIVSDFWDQTWKFLKLLWDVGGMEIAGIGKPAMRHSLAVSCELADKIVNAWPDFESLFEEDEIHDRLKVVADALLLGTHLLCLRRSGNVLPVVYGVVCQALRIFKENKFEIPSDVLDLLKAVMDQIKLNELTPEEIDKLRSLTGTKNVIPLPSARPTLPAPSAPTSEPPKRTNAAPKADLRSYFTTVPREKAVAAIQQQAPPSRPPPPKESSKLSMIREELGKRPKQPNAPSKLPGDVMIHPARPSGFNKKEKPASTTPAVPHTAKPLPPHELEDDSSSDESDHDGLIPLHKGRKRNIDTDRFANLSFNRRLHPPKPDEVAQLAMRMKARMNINADDLHKQVLQWDFFTPGLYPPELKNHNVRVPNTFTSPTEYINVMRPLLLMEIWQQIQQQRETRSEIRDQTFSLHIGRRTNVDDFIDFNVTMKLDTYQELHISENDLILLSLTNPEFASSQKDPANPKPHCYGKVKEGSITPHYSQGQVDLTIRTYRADTFTKFVNNSKPITAERIISLLTAEREYKALMGFPHCELLKQVLNGEPAPKVNLNPTKISQLCTQLGLNESQAKAAYQALNSTGFNLIQGPPGTGKTKTILSILGAYFSNPDNKRILVCAPSNAAVDELMYRVKQGTKLLNGSVMNLKIVRLGRTDAVHPSVQDLCLDRQIEAAVTKKANVYDRTLQEEINALKAKRSELFAEAEDPTSLSEERREAITKELESAKHELAQKNKLYTAQREQLDLARRNREVEYRRVQNDILSNAHVVCCTLSGSASGVLSSLELPFKTVIIDEAAQSVELSALIPFRYGCNRCIMVGDPHQLPPTVLSKAAADLDYQQSLFTRIFKTHTTEASLLDQQFRMHPEIAIFPSKQFYRGMLKTGPEMAEKTERPWHKSPIFAPYFFYDIKDSSHRQSSKSLVNEIEVSCALRMITQLFRQYPQVDFTDKIGVVTPYKQQAKRLKDVFRSRIGPDFAESVTVSTIDAFQGQEKDIIIFSTVRASPDSSTIGFVGDIRRMNVAITRARASLWILGSASTLSVNSEWGLLIKNAHQRKLLCSAKSTDFCDGLAACIAATSNSELHSIMAPSYGDRKPYSKLSRKDKKRHRLDNRGGEGPSKYPKRDFSGSRGYNRDQRRNSYDNSRSPNNDETLPPPQPPPGPPPSARAASAAVSPPSNPEASNLQRSTTPPVPAGSAYRNHAKSGLFNVKSNRKV